MAVIRHGKMGHDTFKPQPGRRFNCGNQIFKGNRQGTLTPHTGIDLEMNPRRFPLLSRMLSQSGQDILIHHHRGQIMRQQSGDGRGNNPGKNKDR